MTLGEAVQKLEAMCAGVSDEIGYGPGLSPDRRDWSRAPTGDRYVSLTHSGVKTEGERSPPNAFTEAEAIDGWLQHAGAYAQKQGCGTLYWRLRPEIRWSKRWKWEYAAVYGRLYVAARP